VRGATLRAAGLEVRNVVRAIQGEMSPRAAGPVVVSGMLAEQLARELGQGAEPQAVVVGDRERLGRAAVLVRVIAGDPSAEDDELVRAADDVGVPVVLVQLWPQERWALPFVLSPFVIECRAGEGFPISEIATRIAEASELRQDLAGKIPALRDAVASRIVKEATVRAALVGLAGGLLGASRPLIALEQARMLSRLASVRSGLAVPDGLPSVAGIAVSALGGGLVLREVSRAARGVLPTPLVNAAVAASATWAFGVAARRVAEIGE
jgi:uncharacterized protein (DUF697 family)